MAELRSRLLLFPRPHDNTNLTLSGVRFSASYPGHLPAEAELDVGPIEPGKMPVFDLVITSEVHVGALRVKFEFAELAELGYRVANHPAPTLTLFPVDTAIAPIVVKLVDLVNGQQLSDRIPSGAYSAKIQFAPGLSIWDCADAVVIEDGQTWKDGTRAVAFEPLDFIAWLAAPRRLNGATGSCRPSRARSPRTRPGPSPSGPCGAITPGNGPPGPALEARVRDRRPRLPSCGAKRKLIALITDGKVVRRILEHLGLPTAAPTLAPARSPPELEFAG